MCETNCPNCRSEQKKPANYKIIRSTAAGVFAGEVMEENLKEGWVKLDQARRLWYWSGAASLSQLAQEGVKKPKECKFSVPTREHVVLGVCETIPVTEKGYQSIQAVPEWRA